MDPRAQEQVSQTLSRLAGGQASAVDELFPLVYAELRRLARKYIRRTSPAQSLQATALVHDAFLRLVGNADVRWESRAHFMAVAAMAMRQILANHARDRRAAKRGGQRIRVTFDEAATPAGDRGIDLVSLHDALQQLSDLDARQAEIVKLRFLGGMTADEVGHVLGISPTTVKREWRTARAWLNVRLAGAVGR